MTQRGERGKIFLLGFVTVAEGLVQIFSLGFLSPGWRAWLLFTVYD